MKTTLILATFLAAVLAAPSTIHPRANLQTFTGALGGIAATPVQDSGDAKRPFEVKGDTFVNAGAALQRSCDQQFNACANAANGGDATLSVGDCNQQKTQCDAAGQDAAAKATGAAAANATASA
ncbi:hypothetical protein EJ04DRAFT_508261 [Polyplosphaeria fusca]|uniref:Uncharacterized protein n=1 Tax=Polyplosphaeria fusca TaxID=682080 RepID=A0A9P4RB70_9PLEO|nr:hypothetical protein EJ04DRAFT_508261 [Polyplosphaeria fusca]